MVRKSIHRPQLIEDIHIQEKRENRARSVNKRLSEQMISLQQREIDNLKRKSKPQLAETYQELSTLFNVTLEEKNNAK